MNNPQDKPMPQLATPTVVQERTKACATCPRASGRNGFYTAGLTGEYKHNGRKVNKCNEMGVALYTIIHMPNRYCPLNKWNQ